MSTCAPSRAADEEPLLGEDYVHVTAPEEAGAAPGGAAAPAPGAVAAPAAAAVPSRRPAGPPPLGDLQRTLCRLWRGLVAACLRSWTLIRGERFLSWLRQGIRLVMGAWVHGQRRSCCVFLPTAAALRQCAAASHPLISQPS